MTKEALKSMLAPHVRIVNLGEGDVDMIVLEYHPDGTPMQVVPVDTMMNHFGHVPDVATHAKLKAEDNGKGYSRFFDQWKAEGLLN